MNRYVVQWRDDPDAEWEDLTLPMSLEIAHETARQVEATNGPGEQVRVADYDPSKLLAQMREVTSATRS